MKPLAGPALLLFTTLAVFPAAARQDDAPVPVFKAQSDLVVLHVNVFDGHSDAVPNLPEQVFQIAEDNQPQQILLRTWTCRSRSHDFITAAA